MTQLSELGKGRDLFVNLTLRELRGKYKRSALGWGWSLLNPLATMAIFTLVFSVLLEAKPDPGDPSGLDVFALFLLCGLLPWNYLSNAMNGGMASLVANAGLVKKVYFPRELLVASSVAAWLVTLCIEMALLAIVLIGFGNMTLPWLPAVIALMAIQTAFVMGIALALSVMNVYFRDMEHLLSIILQFWFYATPIIYPAELVKEHLDSWAYQVYAANPMAHFVEAYRNLLYDLRAPTAGNLAYLTVVSAASLATGWGVFNRYQGRIAEEL